jgi:hypothetical protein
MFEIGFLFFLLKLNQISFLSQGLLNFGLLLSLGEEIVVDFCFTVEFNFQFVSLLLFFLFNMHTLMLEFGLFLFVLQLGQFLGYFGFFQLQLFLLDFCLDLVHHPFFLQLILDLYHFHPVPYSRMVRPIDGLDVGDDVNSFFSYEFKLCFPADFIVFEFDF